MAATKFFAGFLLGLIFAVNLTNAGLCNMSPKLWDCRLGTATLNRKAVQDIVTFPGLIARALDAKFTPGDKIKKVIVGTDVAITLSGISGPAIEEIEITGRDITLKDICLFQDEGLPQLTKVLIKDANILEFSDLQDCGDDSLAIALKPFDAKKLTMIIKDSQVTVKPRAPGLEVLIFDRIYNFDKVILDNVKFFGIVSIDFSNGATKSKLFGTNVSFAKVRKCECATSGVNWQCKDNCNVGSSSRPTFQPPSSGNAIVPPGKLTLIPVILGVCLAKIIL